MDAVPDLEMHITDILADGHEVSVKYEIQGTHSAQPFHGIQPTNKHAKWTAMLLFKLHNGKITEISKEFNLLFAFQQFGWTEITSKLTEASISKQQSEDSKQATSFGYAYPKHHVQS